MAVWRFSTNNYSYVIVISVPLLLLFASSLVDLSTGQHSSPSSHSCSHGHHHHDHDHDHDHDHHHHHHDHDHDDNVNEPVKKRKLLPEELAEEEDLKLYGFGSGLGLDHHHHHHHDHQHGHGGSLSMLSGAGLWIRAMGCSLLVSLASLICLIFIPILCARGTPSKMVVDLLALFGAGAMLGDAFLHQLPHAFGGGGHSHKHGDHNHSEPSHSHSLEDLSVGLSILFGVVAFLIVEKLVRYVEEFSGGDSGTHGHHHHHKKSKKLKADEDDSHKQAVKSQSREKFIDGSNDDTINTKQVVESKSDLKKRNKSNDGKRDKDGSNRKKGEAKSATQPSNRVFGYLNLFSDAVHNFTDGIALGSAFLLYGSVGGWSRTLFLLAHEIPQEVGDFGILVRSGFSVSKALFFNFLSALVALAGTALALLLGQDPGQSSLIEGFTAGGFIYISIAGVLAEMNNNGSPSLKSSVSQLISLVSGMGVALVISLIE